MEVGLLWALLAGRQMSRKQRREGRGVPVQQGAVLASGSCLAYEGDRLEKQWGPLWRTEKPSSGL